MTYQKIFDLKFKQGYSTNELVELFPEEAEKVREIALLQVHVPCPGQVRLGGSLLRQCSRGDNQ